MIGRRMSIGAVLGLALAGGFAGTSIRRTDAPTKRMRWDADQHVEDWRDEMRNREIARKEAERLSAKRERDARWINAAEAKRQRRRAKAALEGRKDG